jgi:ubiquinone/menaquinone biosynthesis C-methylase UbiE
MLAVDDTTALACPGCRGALAFEGQTRDEKIFEGHFVCEGCRATWVVRKGLAKLYDERALSFKERMIRRAYDKYGRFHDPLVRIVFPLLREETSADNRDRYLARLELGRLRPRADDKPVRILEVGVGSGDDILAVRRHLPRNLDVELWGVDVSLGMLRVLRPKLDRPEYAKTKILMGDAHALPFADRTFDRVFHVGALNSYRDPRRALREMLRVAIPLSPIVAVDEWLEENRPLRLRDHVIYRMLTAYDWGLPNPVNFLPSGVTDVRMEQLNPVFYCLSFHTPAAETRP